MSGIGGRVGGKGRRFAPHALPLQCHRAQALYPHFLTKVRNLQKMHDVLDVDVTNPTTNRPHRNEEIHGTENRGPALDPARRAGNRL
jgi:hypothetical protein